MGSEKRSTDLLQTSEMVLKGAVALVCLCGACNILDKYGNVVRNIGRDVLGAKLSKAGIEYFDVQIHPDTHGREYDISKDGPAEVLVRARAKVIVYELRTETSGLATWGEILDDAMKGRNSIVWVRPNALEFIPEGIGSCDEVRNNGALKEKIGNRMHNFVVQSIKDINRMWRYLFELLPSDHKLAIIETDDEDVIFSLILERLKD